MRLLFVNRFYWPETPATGQFLTDLAEALAARGHEVIVITSHSGSAQSPPSELRAGVRVHRIRSTRSRHTHVGSKTLDFATFYAGALWRLWRETRRGSFVIALTDPPLLGVGAWLVARLRGARIIHWVQDIYPELAGELAGQRWLGVLRPLRNLAWRRADRCVTLGADMAAVLERGGVQTGKISVLPNWAPAGLQPAEPAASDALRAAWGLTGQFVIAYAGNLGRVHDLEPALALADALRDDPTITIAFIGGGPRRATLEATAVRMGLERVRFLPAQPRAQLAAALEVGDVHLVTVRPGCENLVFPSKLYGIAAVHRPMIFIGPCKCEIARIVVGQGLGFAAERGDVSVLVAAIRRLAGDPAERRRCAENAARFAAANDASAGTGRWAALLDSLQAC